MTTDLMSVDMPITHCPRCTSTNINTAGQCGDCRWPAPPVYIGVDVGAGPPSSVAQWIENGVVVKTVVMDPIDEVINKFYARASLLELLELCGRMDVEQARYALGTIFAMLEAERSFKEFALGRIAELEHAAADQSGP